jgi:hypothetical protein
MKRVVAFLSSGLLATDPSGRYAAWLGIDATSAARVLWLSAHPLPTRSAPAQPNGGRSGQPRGERGQVIKTKPFSVTQLS